MWEFRNFVLGFSLSLVSVSLTSHLLASPSHVANAYNHDANISIDLYKKNDSIARKIVFSDIHKASLSVQEPINTASLPLASHTSEVKLADLSLSQEVPSTSDVVYSPADINGSEDDEILSINIDNTIPIDIKNTSDATYNAEVSYGDDTDNKIALLPTEVTTDESETSFDSPWVVAQGSKHIKNKPVDSKEKVKSFAGFSYVRMDKDVNGYPFKSENLLNYAKDCHYIVKVMRDKNGSPSLYSYNVPNDKLLDFLLMFRNNELDGTIIEIDKFLPKNII